MGIQVNNSLHAAGSFRVSEEGADFPGSPSVLSQSANGMLITKFIIEDDIDTVFFQIQLDYPLDPGSCAYACEPFIDTDPPTEPDAGQPFVPLLIHITDKEKLLFLVLDEDFPAESLERNFHLQFTNYQANLSEQLPVGVVVLPDPEP